MWIIGPTIPVFKLLIHIDFDEKVKEAFQFKPIFTNPMQPKAGLESLYNVPVSSLHCNLLIGKPETIDEEMINVIQVHCTSKLKISGKVSIFEINKENRFEYVTTYYN